MSQKMTTAEFIEKAVKVHGNKYNYDKVIYVNSHTKVIINCPKPGHGDFEQKACNHLQKKGCRSCAIEESVKGTKRSIEDFIKLAIKVHGNKYDYSESEYIKNGIKLKIICHKETNGKPHGEFWQTPDKHLNSKHGCPKCNGGIKFNLNEFIDRANSIHKNKYDYSESSYTNNSTKIKIICHETDFLGNEHGIFWQLPQHHLNKHGCPKCAENYSSFEYFVEKAKLIHGDKYDYSKVNYINSKVKIKIICHNKTKGIVHGEFWQTPSNHLGNHGCPKCINIISKPEKEWLDYLNIPENYRHKTLILGDRKFNVDAYDPVTNIIYEFFGDYYHGNPNKFDSNEENPTIKKTYGQLYTLTINRENFLKSVGYTIISIWESDWKIMKKNIKGSV